LKGLGRGNISANPNMPHSHVFLPVRQVPDEGKKLVIPAKARIHYLAISRNSSIATTITTPASRRSR